MQTRMETAWQMDDSFARPAHPFGAKRAVAQWVTLDEHEKILDLNCTDAALLSYFRAKYHVHACGICENPQKAHHVNEILPEADVLSGRPADIPWRDNSFDSVVSALSARGYDDFDSVLAEIKRVLRPGGQFVLSAPVSMNQNLSPRSVMRRLQQAGFENVSWRMSGFSGVCIAWKKTDI